MTVRLCVGADRLLAMDLHSGQCVGYFDIPVDHVYGESVILDYLASKRISTGAGSGLQDGDLVSCARDGDGAPSGLLASLKCMKWLGHAPLLDISRRGWSGGCVSTPVR